MIAAGMKPRAILCDLDNETMNKVKRESSCFDQDKMINCHEGGAYTPRGKYTIGKEIIQDIEECIRRTAESCDSLQGFMLYFSPLGGTGGGLTSLIGERLEVDYQKLTKMGVEIVSNQNYSNSVIEPYNFMLSQCLLREYIDL